MKNPKHYFMCQPCARVKGGYIEPDHVCTVTYGTCPYCHNTNVMLVPWVDFNWPADKTKDKKAKTNRD